MSILPNAISYYELREKSKILREDVAQLLAKAYLSTLAFARSARSKNIWKPVSVLPTMQSFASLVVESLSRQHSDMELFKKAKHILCIAWSESWLSTLNLFL